MAVLVDAFPLHIARPVTTHYHRPGLVLCTLCGGDALTDDDIIAFRWDAGDAQLINRMAVDLDYDAVAGVFTKRVLYEYTDSVAQYGPRGAVVLQSQGLRSTAEGTDAFLEDRARALFRRFAFPAAVLQLQVFYRKYVWEVGDIICVSSAFIPNPLLGGRALVEEPFEIVDCRPTFADKGRVTVTLVDVEALTLPPDFPPVSVFDPTATTMLSPLTYGVGGPMARLTPQPPLPPVQSPGFQRTGFQLAQDRGFQTETPVTRRRRRRRREGR